MKLLHIIKAEYIGDYKIRLSFNDGYSGVADLQEKINNDHRKIFEPLKDKVFFKTFKNHFGTIEWENGLDLAPEFLYDLVIEQTAHNNVYMQ